MALRLTVAASYLMIERHMNAEKTITESSGLNSFSQFPSDRNGKLDANSFSVPVGGRDRQLTPRHYPRNISANG